jgi:hypothetical protein
MEDGWGNNDFDVNIDDEDGGSGDNNDNDEDDSFVPESLRAFFKAADQKLEDDLAGLLSPSTKKIGLNNKDEVDDVDDNEGNDDLEREIENARKRDLARIAATKEKEQERERKNLLQGQDQRQREAEKKRQEAEAAVEDELKSPAVSHVLLDIIHPSADVTESHIKRIAMEGVESSAEASLRSNTSSSIKPPDASSMFINSNNAPIPSPIIGGSNSNNTDAAAIILSGTTGGDGDDNNNNFDGVYYSPSPPTNKKVGRKLQMELDREAQRASLSPSSSVLLLSSGDNILTVDDNNDNVEQQQQQLEEETKKQKLLLEKQQRLKELQSKSVERRKKLQEFEDVKRNSLVNTGDRKGIGNGISIDDEKKNTNGDETTDIKEGMISAVEAITITTKSISTPAKNKGNSHKHEINITETPQSTPSKAAATAAIQAAAVVVTAADIVTNSPTGEKVLRDMPEQFVSKDIPVAAVPTKSLDPVQRAQQRRKQQQQQQQQQQNQQRNQQRSFKARPAPAPPIPKELITTIKFMENGEDRSVSPLGTERGLDAVVSPLGNGSPQNRNHGLSSPSNQRSRRAAQRKLSGASPPANKQQRQQRQTTTTTRRRALTRPDCNISDRLLKPTSASTAGQIGVAAVKNKRHEAPRIKRSPEEEQRKARERIRARMDIQKKMSNLRKKTNEGKSSREITTRTIVAKQTKANAIRERLEKMEQERLEKLKDKINAKQERLQTKMDNKNNKMKRTQQQKQRQRDEKENQNRPVVRRNKPTPTIPIAPNFATDRRIHSKDPSSSSTTVDVKKKKKERSSLASSVDIFGQGLRESSTRTKKESAQWSNRTLTIPKAPKLSTSKRHGGKLPHLTSPQRKTKKDYADDNMSWSSTLRDVISPISKAASSVKTMTIPITPQFQAIRKRPLPKSTAEKEKEEMQYYNDHPFKARMVKTHNISKSTPLEVKKLTSPPRPITTPKPFQFSVCKREHKYPEEKDDVKEEITFKAKPAPDFSSNRTSLGSKKSTSSSSRPITTPEPFQFHHTSQRSHGKNSEDHQHNNEKAIGTFKAKPMPDFSSDRSSLGNKKLKSPTRPLTSPDPFKFNGHTSKRSNEKRSVDVQNEKEIESFKARPMPDFSSKRMIPMMGQPSSTKKLTTTDPFHFATKERSANDINPTIQGSRRRNVPSGSSGLLFRRTWTTNSGATKPRVSSESKPPDAEEENEIIFRARAMPNFETVIIPVQAQDPSKIRSPSPSKKKEEECVVSPVFKAKPVPKILSEEPSIPVRMRDSNKLRSPESVRILPSPPLEKKSETFRALPVPSFLDDEPAIRVRQRDPTKLRSPENSSHSRKESSMLQHNHSKHRSPVTPQNKKKTPANGMDNAKARLRERLSKRKSNANRQETNNTAPSPKAFTTSQVKARLTIGNSHADAESKERIPTTDKPKGSAACSKITSSTDNTPVKSNTIPKSIDLPLSSRSPKERRREAASSSESTQKYVTGVNHTDEKSNNESEERDAELERQAKLACALGKPDEDESSSILQLAQAIQRAAEDELSFHGSLGTRESELAFS